jgi:hypothetical protein
MKEEEEEREEEEEEEVWRRRRIATDLVSVADTRRVQRAVAQEGEEMFAC